MQDLSAGTDLIMFSLIACRYKRPAGDDFTPTNLNKNLLRWRLRALRTI